MDEAVVGNYVHAWGYVRGGGGERWWYKKGAVDDTLLESASFYVYDCHLLHRHSGNVTWSRTNVVLFLTKLPSNNTHFACFVPQFLPATSQHCFLRVVRQRFAVLCHHSIGSWMVCGLRVGEPVGPDSWTSTPNHTVYNEDMTGFYSKIKLQFKGDSEQCFKRVYIRYIDIYQHGHLCHCHWLRLI